MLNRKNGFKLKQKGVLRVCFVMLTLVCCLLIDKWLTSRVISAAFIPRFGLKSWLLIFPLVWILVGMILFFPGSIIAVRFAEYIDKKIKGDNGEHQEGYHAKNNDG